MAGHLERLELIEHFSAIACGNEVARPKPAPDVYRAVIKQLDLDPRNAVALEDSPLGVRAAKAAGCFAVGVPGPMTAGLDFGAADLVVPGLDRLPFGELVDRFQNGAGSS